MADDNSSSETTVLSLLTGVEVEDPRLYDILSAMAGDLYKVVNTIFPPSTQSTFGLTGQILTPSTPTGFIFTIYSNNLRLNWDNAGASITYELRYKSGVAMASDWDTAAIILKTATTSADINPLTIPLLSGAHTFLLKTIDASGVYSTTAQVLSLNIADIPAPVITPSVINSNVLLYWTTPTSDFAIDHYNVYKNGILQGQVSGTFEAIFELVGGSYSYTIDAVDIVGNVGALSTAAVVQVSSPVDFEFHASLTSTFSGTKVNCKLDTPVGKLICCIDLTKTWQSHFTTPGWASPAAQIAAGYPLFIQPSLTTGSYKEVFDFGSIINNIIVVMNWNIASIAGSVTVATSTIETSTDNITYTAPVTGFSAFATAVRYVRFTMNFVGADDKSLAYISNLQCLLNVRKEQDGGSGSAVSTDATGTVFTFNKAFLSVDSIVVTPESTTAAFPVVIFAGGVNPTSFKVKVFDDTGTRITKDIRWVARGII